VTLKTPSGSTVADKKQEPKTTAKPADGSGGTQEKSPFSDPKLRKVLGNDKNKPRPRT